MRVPQTGEESAQITGGILDPSVIRETCLMRLSIPFVLEAVWPTVVTGASNLANLI